jgi:hypothetical protein
MLNSLPYPEHAPVGRKVPTARQQARAERGSIYARANRQFAWGTATWIIAVLLVGFGAQAYAPEINALAPYLMQSTMGVPLLVLLGMALVLGGNLAWVSRIEREVATAIEARGL